MFRRELFRIRYIIYKKIKFLINISLVSGTKPNISTKVVEKETGKTNLFNQTRRITNTVVCFMGIYTPLNLEAKIEVFSINFRKSQNYNFREAESTIKRRQSLNNFKSELYS